MRKANQTSTFASSCSTKKVNRQASRCITPAKPATPWRRRTARASPSSNPCSLAVRLTDVRSVMIEQTPRFDLASAERFAREHFGIDGRATPLTSERDQNFLIEARDGRRIVLKIANALEDQQMLAAQQAAMAHLAKSMATTPRALRAKEG